MWICLKCGAPGIPATHKCPEAPAAPLTPEAIAEIRARVDAATSGPWKWGAEDALRGKDGNCILNPGLLNRRFSVRDAVNRDGDAEFIARAPEDVRRLLDAYEELQAENERLEKVESAALGVLATCGRLRGEPSTFSGAPMDAVRVLQSTLQQDAEDSA